MLTPQSVDTAEHLRAQEDVDKWMAAPLGQCPCAQKFFVLLRVTFVFL